MISEVKTLYNVFVAHFYFFCALAANLWLRVSFLLGYFLKIVIYIIYRFIISIIYDTF